MACRLRCKGYMSRSAGDKTYSEIDWRLDEIRDQHSLDWGGELAGWPMGVHEVAGLRILVSRSFTPIKPCRGKCPYMGAFVKTLLSKEQLPYFLGWLQGSLQALQDGYPFLPGQLFALAGGVGCGKSFLQELLTPILGGRAGDPVEFLKEKSAQTGEFLRAEHLVIEDKALKDCSASKRRSFAANLKALIVNQNQRVRPMYRDAVYLPVGMRISVSCNDSPEALAILPSLDDDVADKLIYLLCARGELPQRRRRKMTRGDQWKLFLDELPAFVYHVLNFDIPPEIRDPDNRFTVRAYHHPEIVARLQKLTHEDRLLQLIEVLDLPWPPDGVKTGTAAQIEQWMRKVDLAHQLDRLLSATSSMGQLLSAIAREGEERVKLVGNDGRKNLYAIFKDQL